MSSARPKAFERPRRCRVAWQLVVVLLVAAGLPSCSAIGLESCGGRVLGKDVARIRSSQVRMKLAYPARAAARFVPFAAMSALAYWEAADCGRKHKLTVEDRLDLESILNPPGGKDRWEHVEALEPEGPCEDELGLYYNVWVRDSEGWRDVVVAFRGTWGGSDWTYGNLRWFTRPFTAEDQYERARRISQRVRAYFAAITRTPLRFYATGHSLGGGLAQDVLYDAPTSYRQAIVFDSSSITGFTDQSIEHRTQACACAPDLGSEARIYRVYESYEVLTHLRVWHKLVFPTNRHVQEVRFPFVDSPNLIGQHSMVKLARNLAKLAKDAGGQSAAGPWYSGEGRGCTERFEALLRKSCALSPAKWRTCPS